MLKEVKKVFIYSNIFMLLLTSLSNKVLAYEYESPLFEAVKRSWSEITDDFEVVEKCIFECVEIGDMEDGRLSLICPDQGVKELASKKIDIVKKILSDKFSKDFEIKTVTKQEYTDWEKLVYGESSNDDDSDPEFASLVGSYFPEADIIE